MDINVFSTLKQIALDHRKKLAATFSLVAAENLLLLLYPLVGSLAVNAVLNHNVWQALLYAVMVFAIWAVGSPCGGYTGFRANLCRTCCQCRA